MGRSLVLLFRQLILISVAALAYFGVRGLTEGDPSSAWLNAARLVRFERALGLDLELGIQATVRGSEPLVDLANWIYIWGHWPVIIATLIGLAVVRPPAYFELRNAMFISGAIGLVIFAAYPVTPPRLFAVEYLDTVTMRSNAYRLLQPPNLVNKFAAVPSLHVGWNLLVGLTWLRSAPRRFVGVAAGAMALAMAVALVAPANHWVVDVVLGSVVALVGLGIERHRSAWLAGLRSIRRADRGSLEPVVVEAVQPRSAARSEVRPGAQGEIRVGARPRT